MKVYTLENNQLIKAPIKNVFDFFSKPENLKAITQLFETKVNGKFKSKLIRKESDNFSLFFKISFLSQVTIDSNKKRIR